MLKTQNRNKAPQSPRLLEALQWRSIVILQLTDRGFIWSLSYSVKLHSVLQHIVVSVYHHVCCFVSSRMQSTVRATSSRGHPPPSPIRCEVTGSRWVRVALNDRMSGGIYKSSNQQHKGLSSSIFCHSCVISDTETMSFCFLHRKYWSEPTVGRLQPTHNATLLSVCRAIGWGGGRVGVVMERAGRLKGGRGVRCSL